MNDHESVRLSVVSTSNEEAEAASRVILSGQLGQGPEVARVEELFSQTVGCRDAVAVSNGSAALELSILALGIGPGDEVITTPFSFTSTASSIRRIGAIPVFVDIDPQTFNLDAQLVPAAITPRTAAILPVHLYGRPCDMKALGEIATQYKLALIEDCAQAIGGRFGGRSVGTFGTGTFSFYGTKNITCGEGGMITTNDPAMASRLRSLRNHGMSDGQSTSLSSNFRMTDIQAAILGVQLGRLLPITRQRQLNAHTYDQALSGLGIGTPPRNDATFESCYHQYTITHPARDRFQHGLLERGIETRAYYPRPLHRLPIFDSPGIELPIAESAAKTVLSIPVHPSLSRLQRARVIEAVRETSIELSPDLLTQTLVAAPLCR